MKTAALLLLPCALLTAQDLRVRAVKGQADVQPDAITTGRNSQADIELGPAAGFRLQANSELRIARRDDGRYRFDLVRGGLLFDVLDYSAPVVEIATPSVAAWPLFLGQYEISVSRSLESTIVARVGRLEVRAPAGSQWVETGQKMIARGSPLDPQYRIVSALSVWRRLAILVSNLNWGGGSASVDTGSSDSGSSSSGSSSSASPHTSAPVAQSSASAAATGSHSGHGK